MAKKFNPFHHWLGIDESLTQPNHFQLFGVTPNSEDPIGFRKDVHKRAKVLLAKLEQMSPEEIGERQKLHIKMRRHVVKAHETLMDDKLRAGYLKALRQKAREAKGSAKPLAVPPPSKSPNADDQAASQTGKHESTTLKQSGTPTIKQRSDVNLPDPEPAAIPMAIPLSKPDEPKADSGEVNFDHLKSENISIRPARIKRKKSWLIPILLVIMTLFCIAGIGALVTNFGNIITDPDPDPNPNTATTEPATTNQGGATNADPEPAKPVDPPTPEEIRNATEKLVGETAKETEKSESEMEERTKPSMDDEPAEAASDPDSGTAKGTKLEHPELNTLRFLLTRARREMKRAKLASARKQYDLAIKLIPKDLHISQASITEEIKNGRAVIKRLEGFWEQVAYSSQNFKGTELEPSPGVVIALVEGRDRDIVVKIGGEIVSIPHRSLRPGLALELASKKGAPNVPDWRLQQAAFHVVHSDSSGKLNRKIEELLGLAEEDEYPTEEIRAFWKSDLRGVFPPYAKKEFPEDQLEEGTKLLITGKYESAEKVEVQLASQYATDMTSMPINRPLRRIVALNEAIKLCVRCGNAYQLIDCVDELAGWTGVNSAGLKAEALERIATRFPDAAVPREAAEAFFEFVNSPDAKALRPARLKRLKRKFVEFANGYQLYDLKRLISQTL